MYISGENNPRKDSVSEMDDWSSGFCSLVFSCPLSLQCSINCCAIIVMKSAGGLFSVRNSGTVRTGSAGLFTHGGWKCTARAAWSLQAFNFQKDQGKSFTRGGFFPLWILGKMLYVPVLTPSSLKSMQRPLLTLMSSGLNPKAITWSKLPLNCKYGGVLFALQI